MADHEGTPNPYAPGTIWRSRDPRDNGRRVEITSADDDRGWGNGFIHYRNTETGRRGQSRKLVFLQNYRRTEA